ncbi:MAG TPA: serine/threonine-protein kinase [Thermoanaerobaculia bacterium]|nr:serine/threonine-protein kinase [Thermoanaerobaculia bacterium]
MREIFESALDLAGEDRRRHLGELAARDPELAREVEELFGFLDHEHSFLARPAEVTFSPLTPPDPVPIPRELGAYRILELIGKGGMGSVYRAVRADDVYKKEVAVKVLERGFHDPELVARFRAERRILAELDHPGIAKLLDGGTTPDGRPYFVMERVDGIPIDLYADGEGLTVTQRLRLFLKVCAAVRFAHQNLIVHRDLKPGNILVTRDGEPKLLDFGIAKLLGPGSFDLTVMPTGHGFTPLTPEYASPEQLLGRPVSALADVYSLGVILYELLTGHRPHAAQGQRFDELVRSVAELEPERPSERARATNRKGLARRLAGDLDTIVLVALRKEPERRYSSVEQLMQDVEAHLAGLPVRARPDTFFYRTGKLLSRHPWASAATIAVVLTVATFLIVLVSQRQALIERERQLIDQRNRAEAVSSFMVDVFSIPDPARSRGATVTARELLDRGVVEVERRLVAQPEARGDLLLTMGRTYKGLGLYAEAEPILRRALETRERAEGTAEPGPRVESLLELGELCRLAGRYAEAEDLERKALAAAETMGRDGEELRVRALTDLARTVEWAGRIEEAAGLLEQAYTAAVELAQAELIGRVLDFRASVARRRDRPQDAERFYLEAVALEERELAADHPQLALTLNDLGILYRDQGRLDEAEAVLLRAQRIQRKVYGESHPRLVATLSNLAFVRQQQGKLEEAGALHQEALKIALTSYEPDHPEVVTVRNNLADLTLLRGRADEAERQLREVVASRRRSFEGAHPETAITLLNLARAIYAQGRLEEAEAVFEEALAMTRVALGPRSSRVGQVLNALADLTQSKGDREQARQLYSQAIEILRGAAAGPDMLAAPLHNLGSLERELGNLAAAEQRFREAEEVLAASFGEDHLNLAMTRLSLADVLLERRQSARAEAMARRSLTVLARDLDAQDPWVIAARRILGESLLELRRFEEAEPHLLAVHHKSSQSRRLTETSRECRDLIRLYEEWGKPERALAYRKAGESAKGLE